MAAAKPKPAKANKSSAAGGAKAGAKAGRASPTKASAKARKPPKNVREGTAGGAKAAAPAGAAKASPKARKPAKKRGRGQPPFKPTAAERSLVKTMSSIGNTQVEISLCIRGGIADDTLRKHFKRELETATLIANKEVGKRVYQRALAGDPAMLKWWTACRMAWKPAESDRNPLDGLTIVVNKDGHSSVNK